jgi:putative phage-type endonuclease
MTTKIKDLKRKQSNVITTATRDEWLVERKKGLGGTDVSGVLGLNPYSSPLDVYLDKTDQKPPVEVNEAMRNGHYFEFAVAAYYEAETGNRIIKASADDAIIFDRENPVFRGTPDRRYQTERGKGVLECKSTARDVSDGVPKMWYIQLQWYLMLTGYKFGAIAYVSSFGGRMRFNHVEYDRNDEFIELMRTEAAQFWRDHVLAGVQPEPINAQDVETLFPTHEENKVIQADDSIINIHEKLIELKETKKETESKIDELSERVKLAFGDAEKIEAYGELLFSWKAPKPSAKFDKKAFEKNEPEIYQKYVKTTIGSRRFLVK